MRQSGVIGRGGASPDELEALYRGRFEVFARVAASVTGDAERRRDAVQDAFATAVSRRRSFRGDGPLEAWVWRIVLNGRRDLGARTTPDGPVAWSPDGMKIAYTARDARGVEVMNSDGSDKHQLTRSPEGEVFVAWAPDSLFEFRPPPG